MEHVAASESLDPELVRAEVARGRMVIPANTVHLELGLEPMGIGRKANARSTPTSATRPSPPTIDNELDKLNMAVELRRRHGDGPLHRRQHRRHPPARSSPPAAVPVGTVPIYQVIQQVKKVDDIAARDMLDMVEHQAQQGVDYMTIHAGVLRELHPADRAADHRHRQPGRLADGQVDDRPRRRRTRSTPTSTSCATSCAQYDVTVQPGRRPAARLPRRRHRRGPVRRAEDAGRADPPSRRHAAAR